MMSSPGSNNTPSRPAGWDDRILAAAQKNNADEIHNLVQNHKISPSHANAVGQSALHIACLWGNKEAVQALLSHGANTKAQNRITGATPLHSCVQSSKHPSMNRVECAKMLLEYGADVYLKDLYDMTALDALDAEIERSPAGEMMDQDYVQQMRQVLEAGGKKNLVLIPFVERYDFEGLAKCLQQCPSDKNHEGLGDSWVDVDERDPRNGRTALWIAVDQLASTSTSTDSDDDDLSPDQVSSLSNIIKILLEKGCNPNAIPDKNISDMSHQVMETLSPIYMACKSFDRHLSLSDTPDDDVKIRELKNVATWLKDHGATVTPCVSILHDAARRGRLATLEFCVETLGMDPNTQGRQGLTPLHFAARSGRVDVVKRLLLFSALDPSIVDDHGKTALDAAMVNDKQEIVDLLNAYIMKK